MIYLESSGLSSSTTHLLLLLSVGQGLFWYKSRLVNLWLAMDLSM